MPLETDVDSHPTSSIETPTVRQGQVFSAKFFTYGGIEGPKFVAELDEGQRMFIRRSFLNGEHGRTEYEWYKRMVDPTDSQLKYYPELIWNRIFESIMLAQAAQETNKMLAGEAADIQIIPILPTVLLKSVEQGRFDTEVLDVEVISELGEYVGKSITDFEQLLAQSLTTAQFKKSRFIPHHRQALGYPFIKNTSFDVFLTHRLNDSKTKIEYRELENTALERGRRVAIYKSLFAFNKALMEWGVFWSDQKKDNAILLAESASGMSSLILPDLDVTVFNTKLYKHSPYYTKHVSRKSTTSETLAWLRELVSIADPEIAEQLLLDRDVRWHPHHTLTRWQEVLNHQPVR